MPDTSDGHVADQDVRIFLSHNHDHADVADSIKKVLEQLGPKDITVFTSRSIDSGEQWFSRIKDEIAKADLLIFLYADPSLMLRWCFLEIGLFINPNDIDDKRVLYFYPESENPPDQLKDIQGIRTTKDAIKSFLVKVFKEDAYVGRTEPINPKVDEDELADQLLDILRPPAKKPHYPNRSVILELNTPEDVVYLKENNCLPDQTLIKLGARDALDTIFALGDRDPPWTWGEIRDRAKQRGTTDWVGELGEACAEAVGRGTDIKLYKTVRSFKGAKLFRPSLYKVDIFDERKAHFHVLFTEERLPGANDRKGRMDILANMVHMAYRFRTEVVKPYLEESPLPKDDKPQECEMFCQRLREAYALIVSDSDEHGLTSEDVLTLPFNSKEDIDQLKAVLADWRTNIHASLMTALDNKDLLAVTEELNKLARSHYAFMELCSRRLHELAIEDRGYFQEDRTQQTSAPTAA